MFSCDYNGWADVPEEEREGIDAFEAAQLPGSSTPPAPPLFDPALARLLPGRWPAQERSPRRKAA